MTTLAVALAEIALLKARVEALEAGRAPAAASSAPDSSGRVEPLADHQLDKPWANKTITKDPKQWKGPTQVGRTYSRAPSEWLEMSAHNYEFKAQKGREEVPVRVNSQGKPWHERDSFEAKLLRAWARRNASKPKPAPAPAAAEGGDDDFNFGANVASGADSDLGF